MRLLLFFLICSVSFAGPFIKKKVLKKMEILSIGPGQHLTFIADIDIPEGQKLNEGAPNQISIFEQREKKWSLVKRIDINNKILFPGRDISLKEQVSLSSSDSKLAIDSTIYHCSIDNQGSCYIDDFQKIVHRMKGDKNISVRLKPTKTLNPDS